MTKTRKDLEAAGEKAMTSLARDFDATFKAALDAAGRSTHPIIGAEGEVVGRSRNLRDISQAMSRGIIDYIEIEKLPREEGRLRVKFEDGRRFETFASYHVLQEWLAREKSVRGVMLVVNGEDMGFIGPDNPALM